MQILTLRSLALIKVFACDDIHKKEYTSKDFTNYLLANDFIVDYTPSKVTVDGIEYRGCVLVCGHSKHSPQYSIVSPYSKTEIDLLNKFDTEVSQTKTIGG